MVTYVSLINFTDQGIRNIKRSTSRLKQSQKLAAKFGVKMLSAHYTVGPFDLVAVFEAEDDESISAFTLAVGKNGNVRSTTMRAFTPEEMAAITWPSLKRL